MTTPAAAEVFRSTVEQRQLRQLAGPVDPPSCAPGQRIGPPDFVGVGVQKAGTTWWHHLLLSHPSITGSVRKELHYFQHQWDREFTAGDVAHYHEYFPRDEGQLTGEFTPRYLLDAWTPARLRLAAPDAKLLVLLRDPVERFRSGLTHRLAREDHLHPRFLVEAIERGHYYHQLTRLFQHFPRHQVLVLQFERCATDPYTELRRTFEFLGIDPEHTPAHAGRPVYAARRARVELPEDLRRMLVDEYAAGVNALLADFPDFEPERWSDYSRGVSG